MTPAQLRAIRKRLGLTQAQFAEALGFSGQVHISRLERGLHEITPQTALLARYVAQHGPLDAAVLCVRCHEEMPLAGYRLDCPADLPGTRSRQWRCPSCRAIQNETRTY